MFIISRDLSTVFFHRLTLDSRPMSPTPSNVELIVNNLTDHLLVGDA